MAATPPAANTPVARLPLIDAPYDRPARVPEQGSVAPDSAAERRLREIWETEPGWRGWLSSVDHKEIGLRYIVTAFLFLLLGGVEALVMRVQLARPDQHLLTPSQYDQLFTMHGVTMIFLYAQPILSGFANYLWPLMLGSRDMAFPRLNALSYWIFLFSGLFLYMSFPLGEAPNAGWFNYVPFSSLPYDTGPNIDVYCLGMVLFGISTTVGSVNFVVTLFRMRAPGMSLDRLPIIVWGTLTASLGNLFAVPAVSLAFFMLWLDRHIGSHFFDAADDGRPLLWQHLFWMFAHPWVYVVVLPAMGIVSDALPTFCRRPLVGYSVVALSTIATMLLGFEVWVHHMFATGLPPLALAFFGAASMLIAIPSALTVFAWIATIWTGRPVYKTPFLYFVAFVFLFVVGGVSGVMTAAVPLDLQLTDTYFVVAHLHYVLLGINVFPVLGGICYWFPKFTGRMMSERLGKWAFWVIFVGFNVGFFPMHISGLLGMPRRIYTYPEGMGWDTSNMLTSVGSFVFAFGLLLFLINACLSWRRGAEAGANPWDASTLEWSIASPPPPYNFAVLPTIVSRHPLWETRLDTATARSALHTGYLLHHGRETIAVTALEGRPDAILKMPEDTYAPLLLAAAATVAFGGLLWEMWWLTAVGVAACLLALLRWMWPTRTLRQRDPAPATHLPTTADGVAVASLITADAITVASPDTASAPAPSRKEEDREEREDSVLPIGSDGRRSVGWWGMLSVIVTEASLFAYLIFSYLYLGTQTRLPWPPEGLPKLGISSLNTVLLLASSVFVWFAERCIDRARLRLAVVSQLLAIALGTAFVAIQVKEWHDHPYTMASHLYGSLYFIITGFHIAHVVFGLGVLCCLAMWTGLGYFGKNRKTAITVGGLYWHFVDVVWLFIFTTLYLTPYWFR